MKTGTALSLASQSTLPLAQTGSLSPPLKWAGGKRWLIPYLLPYWESEQHRRLVEPFCGGLAVSLGLRPGQALQNDINPHLINFYRWLKKGLVIDLAFKNNERDFYRSREEFNRLLRTGREDTKEAASLFYYLNRTGYNGLCRFNSQGQFNVPFGKYENITYRYDFRIYKAIIQDWVFANVGFNKLRLKPTDFVYADPPYDVQFRQYSKGGFSWQEQEQTAEWLSAHPGPVILSNQATTRILELYQDYGFTIIKLNGPRRISCTGDRTPAREVLAIRNLEPLPGQQSSVARRSVVIEKAVKQTDSGTSRGRELTMKESSSDEKVKAWLARNGYEDYVALINDVEAEWKAKGSKERKNWWLIMSGGDNGRPKIVCGRVFPVLAAFQERQGKPVTENAERRNPDEIAPKAKPQARWASKKRKRKRR
ncbi:MAG TPA: Dam family site-specific DNA-(adenine-N6)-methyltransferase [Pyrinomonadaceae bacterium]|nr:Dam family site-specific DNA-(adenine-N6)-methyltransferase [Pyrinomonadaceae bacterium]